MYPSHVSVGSAGLIWWLSDHHGHRLLLSCVFTILKMQLLPSSRLLKLQPSHPYSRQQKSDRGRKEHPSILKHLQKLCTSLHLHHIGQHLTISDVETCSLY